MHTKKINIKNYVHHNYEDLIEPKKQKIEARNILIDKKCYKKLVIYFFKCQTDKSITILNLYYDKLIGKIEKYEGQKYLMVVDYTLDKVLVKIKGIVIEKLGDIRILIDTDDIILKNAVILMTCVITDGDKFYPHLFLEEVLHNE